MKKALSILLSVMLILGTISCLMVLPATANTAVTGPVNLITNGDLSMGQYTAEEAENSSYPGEIVAGNRGNARYWRASSNGTTFYANAQLFYAQSIAGYGIEFENHSGGGILVPNVWGQNAMQDIVLERGKTYEISAKVALHPTDKAVDTANNDYIFDIYLDNGVASCLNPTRANGKSYNLVFGHSDMVAEVRAWFNTADADYAKNELGYYETGDFRDYSIVFNADDFLADYPETEIAEDGTFSARLCLLNNGAHYVMFDDITAYEVNAVTATDGGVVSEDYVPVGANTTLTATPFFGNSFEGWYIDGECVSTNRTYVGTVASDITAKFTEYNQIADGDLALGGDYTIDYFNSHIDRGGAGRTADVALSVVDVGGTHGNVLYVNPQRNNIGYSDQMFELPVTVKKNTTYSFTFKMNQQGETFTNIHAGLEVDANNDGTGEKTYVMPKITDYHGLEGTQSTHGWSYNLVTNGARPSSWIRQDITGLKNVNTWYDMSVNFETGSDASVFGTADTATVYLIVGLRSQNDTANFYLDDLCFAEVSTTSPADITKTDGGDISGTAYKNDVHTYIANTASGNKASDIYYAQIANPTSTLTATPYFGNSFAGWYKGNILYSDSNSITTEEPGLVAKFNKYNLVDNGDFSGDAQSVITRANLGTYEILTEADGNKFFRATANRGSSTTSGSNDWLYSYAWNFELDKDSKYIISYKLRAGHDSEGNLLSTVNSSYKFMILPHISGTNYSWTNIVFESSKLAKYGSHSQYTNEGVNFNSSGSVLNPGDESLWHTQDYSSFPGYYTFTVDEWVDHSFIVDTTTVIDSDGISIINDNGKIALGMIFGANSGDVVFDLDDIVISKVKEEYTVGKHSLGGGVTLNRIASTEVLPVTYTAYPNSHNDYVFDGWYDSDNKLVSKDMVYSPTSAADLYGKFVLPELDINEGGDFEDNFNVDRLGAIRDDASEVVVGFGTYTEEEKDLDSYDSSMGDKYLKITKGTGGDFTDISIPVTIGAGNKYLAHMKVKINSLAISDTEVDDNQTGTVDYLRTSRFDVRLTADSLGWTATSVPATVYANTATVSKNGSGGYGAIIYRDYGSDAGFIDWYIAIDGSAVTEDTQAFITFGLKAGGEYEVDNLTVVDLAVFAPELGGAMVGTTEATEDKVGYTTKINLPDYLGISKVATYLAPTTILNNTYGGAHDADFTSEIDVVAEASVSAAKTVIVDENGDAFKRGTLYTYFKGVKDAVQTDLYSARSVITVTDAYGNDLGIELATANESDSVKGGVYKRSLNQIRRLAARDLLTNDAYDTAAMKSLAAEYITPVAEKTTWNCAMDEVWNFVKAAYNK